MEKNKILIAKNVTKIYGVGTKNPYTALKDVSLEMEEGEFICVMGPSGAGKSTFINNLSTIDLPTKGFVYINGKEVRQMSEREIGRFRYENLGFIFQEFNLLDSLTIFENIAVPLTLAGKKKKDIQESVNQIAKKLGVEMILNKYPSECSGGQRQRAAICRALVTKPKLIVADEPTGNLDSIRARQLMNYLVNINVQYGVTIVMVTHDCLVASYASQMYYVEDGKITNHILKNNDSLEKFYNRIAKIAMQLDLFKDA